MHEGTPIQSYFKRIQSCDSKHEGKTISGSKFEVIRKRGISIEVCAFWCARGSSRHGTMGARQSKEKQQIKRQRFLSTIEQIASNSLHRASILPTRAVIAKPFTKLQALSEEWNLCGQYDPTRRVNVVADLKLQRKRLPHHLVEKCVRLKARDSVVLIRNELEILAYLVANAKLHIGYMHPNLIQLRGYYSFMGKIHVFVEFCELGSLRRAYLEEPSPLLRIVFMPIESELRDAMRQICSGLAFLHANGVAHCDLALENIFVTSDNVLKIGDFERAVFVGAENVRQRPRQTEPWRKQYGAPELYVDLALTTNATYGNVEDPNAHGIDLQKADVWALGVILITMFTKKPLFDSTREDDKGFQLFKKLGLFQYLRAMYLEQSAVCRLSEEMIELANGLLCVDPQKRLTAAEALESRWLTAGDADDDDVQIES